MRNGKTEIPEQGEYGVSIYKLQYWILGTKGKLIRGLFLHILEQGDYRADIVMSFLRNGLQNIYLSDNLGRKEDIAFYQQQNPQCGWIQ